MSDIETQDTEPLSPDAQRIVELERRVRELERHVVKTNPVLLAALLVGRHWNDQDGVNAQHIDALADAVQAFDALQPKG